MGMDSLGARKRRGPADLRLVNRIKLCTWGIGDGRENGWAGRRRWEIFGDGKLESWRLESWPDYMDPCHPGRTAAVRNPL